jgi:pimeloyl-ACP methyl ester carboxylesterase
MPGLIPWNSQPLDRWAERHAKGKFVELGGRRTHYIEKGSGPVLILLHGFFYDSYLWAENIDALARHFKVYAIDLWGCGFSTRELLNYGYPLYAEQLRLFMDALNIDRASLVGQSMGAGTAIKFCVQHRQRVDKLVLVSAAAMPNPLPLMAKFFNLPGIGEFLLNLKTDAFRKAALTDVFIHNKALVTDAYFENVTRAQKIRNTVEVGLKIQRANFFGMLGAEVRQLGDMDVPVLLVWGREDKATPLRCGQQMHAILKGSRLEILDKAGHVPNFEQAERFNRLAVDFLRLRSRVETLAV